MLYLTTKQYSVFNIHNIIIMSTEFHWWNDRTHLFPFFCKYSHKQTHRLEYKIGFIVMMRNMQRSGDFWENKNFPWYLIALWFCFDGNISTNDSLTHPPRSGGTRWINDSINLNLIESDVFMNIEYLLYCKTINQS